MGVTEGLEGIAAKVTVRRALPCSTTLQYMTLSNYVDQMNYMQVSGPDPKGIKAERVPFHAATRDGITTISVSGKPLSTENLRHQAQYAWAPYSCAGSSASADVA